MLEFSSPRFFKKKIENFLEERKSYIGGSESYALVAESLKKPLKWQSPFTVWCEKVGFHVEKTSKYMENGKNRESVIFDYAKEKIEREYNLQNIELFSDDSTYFLTEKPYIAANLDGLVKLEDGEFCGLEIKTSSSFFGWGRSIPMNYWSQVQHYMLVTGLKCFFVIVEVADECRVYRIFAHADYQAQLEEAIDNFWVNCVLTKINPKPSFEKFEIPYLDHGLASFRAFPFPNFTDDCRESLIAWQERKARSERLKRDLQQSVNHIKPMSIRDLDITCYITYEGKTTSVKVNGNRAAENYL